MKARSAHSSIERIAHVSPKSTKAPERYAEPTRYLRDLDTDWARHIERVGPCVHQTYSQREPYEALIRAVAHQQLHAKAAEAILERLRALHPGCTFPTPSKLLGTSELAQRQCGFSARKLTTIRAIARATLDGIVPSLEEASTLDDEALVERLVPLPGIGRWTVEMFLIYSLERLDILPVDDYGVREGYRRLKGLPDTPTAKQMRAYGEPLRPFRTIASWYLWRFASP